MKPRPPSTPFVTIGALAFVLVSALLPAQESAPTPAAAPEKAPLRTEAQLDELLGPVALYPDALIALILPASTEASDVVLASRFLAAKGDPAQLDAQPWDDSVRALARYPEVITWLDTNLAWTKQLGDAFSDQPADVMKAVQRLRARARAAGTLTDTPQQQIVVEADTVRIIPAQPTIIYVPRYDPAIVYVRRAYHPDPFFTFGLGYATGFWLSYELDWGRRTVWVINRHERERYWHQQPDWRRPAFPHGPVHVQNPNWHPWRPAPGFTRPPRRVDDRPSPVVIVRPAPIGALPPRPYGGHRDHGTPGPNPPGERAAPRRPDERPRDNPAGRLHGPVVAPLTGNPANPSTPPSPTSPPPPSPGWRRGGGERPDRPRSFERDTPDRATPSREQRIAPVTRAAPGANEAARPSTPPAPPPPQAIPPPTPAPEENRRDAQDRSRERDRR